MTSRYSICQGCLNTPEEGEPYDSDRDYDYYDDDEEEEEDSDDEAAFVEDEY